MKPHNVNSVTSGQKQANEYVAEIVEYTKEVNGKKNLGKTLTENEEKFLRLFDTSPEKVWTTRIDTY